MKYFLLFLLNFIILSCTEVDEYVLPEYIKKIKVINFVNQTTKLGIEELFTNYVIDNLLLERRVEVVEEGADAELHGKIIKYFKEPIFYNEAGYVTEYRIWIIVEITLIDKVMKKKLVDKEIIEDYINYIPRNVAGGDKNKDNKNKKNNKNNNKKIVGLEEEAIKKLIKKLAQDIVLKVTRGW